MMLSFHSWRTKFAVSVVIALVFGVQSSFASLEEGREIVKDVTKFLSRKFFPIAQEVFFETNISAECSASLLKTMSALRLNEPWALKMLTAGGYIPSGIMYLTLSSLGSYGQCLSTVAKEDNETLFTGQYCGLHVLPSEEVYASLIGAIEQLGDIRREAAPPLRYEKNSYYRPGLRLGLCVPSVCTEEELSEIVSTVATRFEQFAEISSCHTQQGDNEKDSVYYFAILLPCVLIFITFTSTLLDLHGINGYKFVQAFSASRNHRQLIRVNKSNLAFLHGLKALLAYWIVIGHCYLLIDPYSVFTVKEALDLPKTIFFQIAATGAFTGVTIFFVASGFIASYSFLSSKNSTPGLQLYVASLFRRYYRLMVPAVVVLVVALGLPYFAHGPLTDAYFHMFTRCKNSWFKIPLELVNTDSFNDMCLSHYWYISVDYQIMILIFPIMIIYKSHPKAMTVLVSVVFVLSAIAITATTYLLQLLPFMGFNADQSKLIRVLDYVYFLPTTHIGSVALGLMSGFLAFKYQHVRIPSYISTMIWTIVIAVSLVTNIVPIVWYHEVEIPRWADAFYAGIHRHLNALSAAWIVFICSTGNAKTLSSILSNGFLVVLGKLSFGIYLVHYPILIYFVGINGTQQQILNSRMVRDSIGIYFLSAGVSYILHLCVEAPVIVFDTFLFKRGGSPKQNEHSKLDPKLMEEALNHKMIMLKNDIKTSCKL